MEYSDSWMYGSLRFTTSFREEVDKFIEAAEKHAATFIMVKSRLLMTTMLMKQTMLKLYNTCPDS
jgi:hypothetical protein